MRKYIILIILLLSCALPSACGSLSDKVVQTSQTIEIGSSFDVESVFSCEDGISIKLKAGQGVNLSELGEITATFIISDGKSQEEKDFSFEVVDTVPPEINAKAASICRGMEFIPQNYVTVKDNSGETISATVESSNVDTSVLGEYPVTFSASDSSGNIASKTVDITVSPLETVDEVADVVEQYMSQNGYTQFECGTNADYYVFMRGPTFKTVQLDSMHSVLVYPEVSIYRSFSFDSEKRREPYRVEGIIFRFQFFDKTKPLDDRLTLNSDKMSIRSGNDAIDIAYDEILSDLGEYDVDEYMSNFHYKLEPKYFDSFGKMLSIGDVVLDVGAKYEVGFNVYNRVFEPYTFEYALDAEEIEILQSALDLAEYFVGFLGEL